MVSWYSGLGKRFTDKKRKYEGSTQVNTTIDLHSIIELQIHWNNPSYFACHMIVGERARRERGNPSRTASSSRKPARSMKMMILVKAAWKILISYRVAIIYDRQESTT